MERRNFLKRSANFVGLVGLWLMSCSAAKPLTDYQSQTRGSTMKLESGAFSANGMIPSLYTCDGQDMSPPLMWDDPPVGTQSFALIVDDPDAPSRTFVHWVLYDLPVQLRSLEAAIPANVSMQEGSGIQGKNDFGKLGYGGPCPPSGTHRYFFKLYALDQPLGLGSGATKAQVEAAMKGHILAKAELIGRYARQR